MKIDPPEYLFCNKNIDVIFPSNVRLEEALSSLKRKQYAKGKVSLSKLVEKAAQPGGFVKSFGHSSGASILSTRAEDIWCIDYRGVLTLSVCGDSYQTLGLVGSRVSFGKGKDKEGDGRHVITLGLQPHAETEKNRARRNETLKRWEDRRQGEVWEVFCYSGDEGVLPDFASQHLAGSTIKDTNCETFHLDNVKIPVVQLSERPKDTESLEDHEESLEELIEWIGMAGLHAQRMQANDRVDPFIAVYEAPSPNQVGPVTHLRWTGLLAPPFVQAMVDCIINSVSPKANGPQFVSVVGHACNWSPVCYIPSALVDSAKPTPIRDPTMDEEDSWCLVLTPGEETTGSRWILAESVGKHDARWG
ncbi:hypothetical protein V5O48_001553 [Marasmius crinis-equi]|uniref:Uncharacterized protein n=1 Tax=Marasmius crinis-equi TaxID=585013 RepID=A0ABR3FYV6_9AGAR